MGRKGKSKGGSNPAPSAASTAAPTPAQSAQITEIEPIIEKIEEKKTVVVEEVKKIEEPPKVVNPVIDEKPKPENAAGANSSNDGTLKSKKNKNKKQKTGEEIQTEPVESSSTTSPPKTTTTTAVEAVKTVQDENDDSPAHQDDATNATETLNKKKRNRNKNKKKSNVTPPNEHETTTDVIVQEVKIEPKPEPKKAEEVKEVECEKKENATDATDAETLKKKKRNRNKKSKGDVEDSPSPPPPERKVEEPTRVEELPAAPAPPVPAPQPSPKSFDSRKSKNKKSKRSILDELQEKQDREQHEARQFLKKEINKREKLLEKIDMVLDCHINDALAAKNQQMTLNDITTLTNDVAASPVTDPLSSKIDQVLSASKREIVNVHQSQEYVGGLEKQLNRLKKTKDSLYGESSSTDEILPEKIKSMQSTITDIKEVNSRSKDELINEIQSRDALMTEINKVLDNTKTEIEKVKKQQKIITNLEGELQKMKENEIGDKLSQLGLNMDQFEDDDKFEEAPPMPKPSASSASLLDALMANVGKLKEIHAQKQKQKEDEEKIAAAPVAVEGPPKKVADESPKKEAPKKKENKKQDKSKKSSEVKKSEKEEEVVAPKENDSKKVVDEPKKVNEPTVAVQKVDELKPVETSKVIVEKQKTVELPKEPAQVPETKISEVKIEDSKVLAEPENKSTPAASQESPKNNKKHDKKSQKNQKNQQQQQKSEKPAEVKEKSEEKVVAAPAVVPAKVEEIKKVEPVIEAPKVEKKVEVAPKPSKPAPVEKPAKVESPKPVEVIAPPPPVQEVPKVEELKDEMKKDSPKSSPKNNKHHRGHGKKGGKHEDIPIGPPIVPVEELPCQKPSIAEMLRNAPDPPPEEEKPPEKAPLAAHDDFEDDPDFDFDDVDFSPITGFDSTPAKVDEAPKKVVEIVKDEKHAEKPVKIDEVKKVEVKELPKPVEPPKAKTEDVKKSDDDISLVETELLKIDGVKLDESIVLVDKVESKKENKRNSKNAEGSGFVSPAKNDQTTDTKPLGRKNEKKASPGKSPSPVKAVSSAAQAAKGTTSPRNVPASRSPTKPAVPPKPKNLNSKPSPDKKLPLKTNIAESVTAEPVAAAPISPPAPQAPQTPPAVATEKPKIPPKPESLKNAVKSSPSPSRSPPKSPNVTTHVAPKSKTPSPVKPIVVKPAVAPVPIPHPQPSAPQTTPPTKQKPAVPPRPANIKQPNNKPKSAPNKKPNTTKSPTTSKSATPPAEVSDSDVSQSAFSQQKMNKKSIAPDDPTPVIPDKNNSMKAMLNTNGSIQIIISSSDESSGEENPREILFSDDSGVDSGAVKKSKSSYKASEDETSTTFSQTTTLSSKTHQEEDDDDDELSQYKQSPRAVFLSTVCHVCKVNLSCYLLCQGCKMIAYCKEDHLKVDYLNHKALCLAIQLIAKRRGGHVYHMAKHLSTSELRNLKAYTIFICEQFLNRNLQQYEREIFIFPRLCQEASCREWKPSLLVDCMKCGQVSYCTNHPLPESHSRFCESFALFQRIVLRQKAYGRIELNLPHKVLKKSPILSDTVDDSYRLLYRNITAFKDDCVKATLSHISTCPLTAFYAQQLLGLKFDDQMVIHLVGSEMQFEGLTLNKWEAFFLHLLPEVSDVLIVFIGPELNTDNLPIEIISRIRMCRSCRQYCRCVRFDFQCSKFYHDYCSSSSYIKPNLVCFFNPSFRKPGFRGFDTWPKTVKAAIASSSPVLITASTEMEAFLDLEEIEKITSNEIEVVKMPQLNPYKSTRPVRNISCDDEDPIMYKNQYFFIIRKPQDLIAL